MIRSEAISLIKQQLGFRTTGDAAIIQNLIAVQVDLEAAPTKPWFLVSEDAYTLTTPDDERLFIPSDFLEEVEDAVFKYVPDGITTPAGEIDLIKDDYDVLRMNYRDTPQGPPQAYALMGNYFRLFPTPDLAYTVHLIYYQKDAVLDSEIENKWLKWAPKLVMGKAGRQMATALRDTLAVTEFTRWEAEGRILLTSQTLAREQANMSRQIGGPH